MADPSVPATVTPVSPSTVDPAFQPTPEASLVPLGIPGDMVFGGLKDEKGVAPQLAYMRQNLLRNIGLKDEPQDPFTGAVAAPLAPFAEAMQKYYPAGRPLPELFPEYKGGYDPLPPAALAPHDINWTSISLALRSGLDESPLGSLLRFDQLRKAMTMHKEPGYDQFSDRQIYNAGMGNQMYLFAGSQSRDMTTWMIDRFQEKARNAEYVERMGAPGTIAHFAGGILGDPLTYLPATVGLKSTQLASRVAAGTISAAEAKLISAPSRVFWGSLADSVANISVTAGSHVMGRLAENFANPSSQLDDVLDSLFIPTVLAGSVQFVSSAFERRAARGLKDEVRQPDFLRGRGPSGARYVKDDFIGPVIHPDDEAASALASRYDDAHRRLERVDYGLTDPRTSLPGDSDYAAGKFGKQTDVPYNGLPRNGDFSPHSLATNYGPLRTEEALNDTATAAILRTTGAHPGLVVGGVDTGKGTPRTLKGGWQGGTAAGEVGTAARPQKIVNTWDPDYRGIFSLSIDGKLRAPGDFAIGHHFVTEQGTVWKVSENDEGRKFFQTVSQVRKPRGTGRAVDQVFAPGELEDAGAPDTTSAHVAALPGANRMTPSRLFQSVEKGTQQGYVVMPDGKIFELGTGFSGPGGQSPVQNGARGLHSAFFAHFPDLTNHAMRLVRFGDELAADVPAAGRTEQQTAALRGLKAQWDRQGLGDRIRFDTAPIEDAASGVARAATLEETQAAAAARTADEGSVGAAISPQSMVYRREVLLAQGRMAPTGIGLEKLPLDPVARTFQGLSVLAMQLVSDLVSTGGRLTVGNLMGKAMGTRAPVEMLIEANWGKPVVDLIRSQHDAWHEYKMMMAKAGGQTGVPAVNYAARTDFDRLAYEVGDALKSMINRGDPGMSFNEFRLRVAKALNNGDVDELTDAASHFVNREAGAQRAFYNKTRDLAVEHGVFDEAYEKARDLAASEVHALKKEADDVARRSRLEKWDPARTRAAEEALIARTEDAQFRLKQTEEELSKLRQGGPTLNGTAPSYRPRLWDVGELTRHEDDFVSEISEFLQMKSKGTLDTAEAVRQAKEIHNLVSRQNPVYDRGDMEALFKSVASPGSAMARSLTIPDKMIEKYLVNDSEVLLRYHARQMGTAIEMKQRFGSLDLKEQIAEIQGEYRALMRRGEAEAKNPPTAADKAAFELKEGVPWAPVPPVEDLEKMMNGAIEDMQVLRDRLYGTHGASADPHNWTSRTVRMAKQFANITLLGMSGISSLGDFVRPLMTEGLDSMYGHGLRSLMSDARGTILNLARKDMELAGTGMDLMNNVRALQAADTGDVFGSRGRLEHMLGQANNWLFVANGLNQLTEWSKRWSSVMIQGRMNEAIELFAHTGKGDATDIARLAAANIDHDMARRIAQQLEYYGAKFDNIKLANLGQWDDEVAAELYKSMLYQHVNRTVVTPGLGDRANWMSTELGSLVSQYKAWGVANLVRGLQSGLQEGGNQFWYGAAAAVGFALLLNEVRSRLFYDHSTFDRPATAVIADAVDRSSILGWFSDANRAIETLSGNRLGFKPLMGAAQPHPVDAPNAVGTVLGPAAGQATRAASVLNDFIQGHPTAKTYNNWRTVMPGNTLPYLDPAYDHTISDGNFRRSMDRSAEQKRRLGLSGAAPAP